MYACATLLGEIFDTLRGAQIPDPSPSLYRT